MTPLWLFVGGLGAGFVNTLAGGGSLIALPLLMAYGLNPSDANAANRIQVLAQSSWASFKFHRALHLPWSLIAFTFAFVLFGALLGIAHALFLSPDSMKLIIAIVLGLGALSMLLNPIQGLQRLTFTKFWHKALLLMAIGYYGGLVQAGVGMLLLWMLSSALNLTLTKANALKSSIIALYTALALLGFVLHGFDHYAPGLIMALGSFLGSLAGTRVVLSPHGKIWMKSALALGLTIASLRALLS